ncbi:amino acid permease [Laetiporus sulphureus 93-53]|uniref:Amino acid permease n=1 Tax=Laetiporus sulphureus 93-53 TaxID=1314785 RepID=A0A165H4L3_9APHY|nr:amino acid permease [Laetiporus sulphureus 93-53]KZT11237.1 amino acid permease [Laetiporus sulphureus 93-53]
MSEHYTKETFAETDVKATDYSDSEANHPSPRIRHHGLQRQMKNRHIAMISIGGVIGTGLFLGTATSLKNGGPVGLLLGYLTIGSLCFCTMLSLGEMAAFLPVPGGHITFAERFVDPAWSFALGWQYWYNWTIVLPAELSAAAVLINYWNQSVNNAVWITMCLIVVILINMFGAGVYGEAEFVFASIKVITITGLIILGIVLDLGGGPNHDRIGFRYWKHPGPFAQYDDIPGSKGRFLAWWAVMTQAAFSFIGTEVVAIAGAEAKNPRRNIPMAIRNVYIRILLFYIGGVTIIGLLVPYTNPDLNLANGTAAASPFVIAIRTAGIKGLPSVINACLLTSAWSAGNSDLYSSSRALYSLAINGNAPRVFAKTNRWGIPWVALIVNSILGCLAYMDVGATSGKVFGWLSNMTAIAGLSNWFAISVTYVRFRKGLAAQGIDRKTLPFASALQPYAAWWAIFLSVTVCFFSGWSVFLKGEWNTATFVTNYLPMMLFPVMYLGKRLWSGVRFVRPEDMDFKTGLAEVLEASYDEEPPRNWVEHVWAFLF